MHKDFHLYGTYIAARCAGFNNNDSKDIACAAQAVDDFKTTDYQTCCDPLNMPIINKDKLIKFWTYFHFLPTMINEPIKGSLKTEEKNKLRFRTAPKGKLFDDMQDRLETSCKSSLYEKDSKLAMIGVTLHVLADTFAHEGFSGYPSEFNCANNVELFLYHKKYGKNIASDFGEHVYPLLTKLPIDSPNIGHGTVGHLPDLSWVEWSMSKKNEDIRINASNAMRFKKAIIAMQELLSKISGTTLISLRDNDIIDKCIVYWQDFNALRYENEKAKLFTEENDVTFREILDDNKNNFKFADCISSYNLKDYYENTYLKSINNAAKDEKNVLKNPFVSATTYHSLFVTLAIDKYFTDFPKELKEKN